MEIKVTEKEILSGDISKIKTIIDQFAPDSRLSSENEGNISVKFSESKSFELATKLKEPTYKAWFKKLDSEYPYLPFFLNKQSKTLMFFVMGNTEFKIDDKNNIEFEETSKKRYIRSKVSAIFNFCVSHNINPKAAVSNLTSFEPESSKGEKTKQLIKIIDSLEKFSSVAAFNKQREFVIWLRLSAHPSELNIVQCHYINNCPQPYFCIIIENAGDCLEYSTKIFAPIKDVEDFIKRNSSIKIVVVFKDNNENQSIPLMTHFDSITQEELNEERKKIKNAPEKPVTKPEEPDETLPQKDVEKTPEKTEKSEERTEKKAEETPKEKPEEKPEEKSVEKTDNKIDENFEEEVDPPDETPEETIARLKKENRELKIKNRQMNALLGEYEEAINRLKHPIASFFKKLFK